ncbi:MULTISPECIES: chondroitinase family polysaccharide lyase [unclassified Carboxylicivirga]|uniref:chondroitinase family polysaccharide lyase n=1 Tax=Carboxylicivirga TaxID=1628153 RepID=UPI003D32DA5F
MQYSAHCFLLVVLFFRIGLNSLVVAQTFIESNTFDNCETFENDLPSNWKTEGGGLIETSTERYKQGQQSLKWSWQKDAKIVVTDRSLEVASSEKNAGMHIWLYSSADINDSIEFRFYDAFNRLKCQFYYRINFVGWRGLWVRFWDDIAVADTQVRLSKMEIRSPNTANSGELFFDIVEFKSSISYKRSPSYQYAHPYPYADDEEVKDEWASLIYQQRYPQPTAARPDVVSDVSKQAFNAIALRFNNWLLGTDNYTASKHMQARLAARSRYISSGVNLFNNLALSQDEQGRIHGPGLFSNKSPHGPKFGRDMGEKLCLQLALDYRVNGTQASKEKLLLLYDYMHDQGWAAGSAMETTDHQKLRTAAWAYSVYLLHDDLKTIPWKDGKTILDREMATLHWLCYFNIIFAPLDNTLEVSVDDFRSATLMRLMYILMMDNNNPTKVQYMNHYTQWINRNLRTFQGWTGGIKPDGMGYHHRGPYMNAYSNNGVHIMSQVLYFLRHTAFDADHEAKQTVKKYLLNYRTITGFYDVPKGVSGRISGLEKVTGMLTPMAYMAQCMSEDALDEELASAAMAYWKPQHQPSKDLVNKASMSITYFNTPGEIEAILDVETHGVEAAENASGLWIKPYAAMAVFRDANWFVSLKGTSAYVWDYESGNNENAYGRYDSYGQMEIINNQTPYPSMVRSGHDYNKGWDWSRVPGTTTLNMELHQLKSDQQRMFTPNTFVGGVEQENKTGLWAMEFNDVNYGTRLAFKKSVFFFQPGVMVCLGSNIASALKGKTESTILQNVISSSGYAYKVNGEPITSDNYVYNATGGYATLLDNQGKGIYVPNDNGLNIVLQNRQSETMRCKASNGDVLTAWMNHGYRNNYEYLVLMETTQEELDAMDDNPVYEIIQHDAKAHIVKHIALDQTGYALFEPNEQTNDAFVHSSSLPLMLMVSNHADGRKQLSVCNPDFNRSKPQDIGDVKSFDDLFGPFPTQWLELTLKGAWAADNLPDNVSIRSVTSASTVLQIETHDAETYDFELKKDSVNSIAPGGNNQYLVWPNPTAGIVNFPQAETAALYNLNGRLIRMASSATSFDLVRLSNGIYILECINGEQCTRTKVIKNTTN